jgi:hypothetical protein
MQRAIGIVVCLLALGIGGNVPAQETAHPPWLLPATEWTDVESDWLELIVRHQDSVYDEPLTTDRLDFTESSSTVGRGVLQLEMGYTYVYDDNEADGSIVHSHNTPETLFRYGVSDRVEVRLFWNYIWERTIDGAPVSFDGAEDFAVGTKIEMWTEQGFRPETAVILEFGVPTGGSVFSTNHLEWARTSNTAGRCQTIGRWRVRPVIRPQRNWRRSRFHPRRSSKSMTGTTFSISRFP